MTGCSLQKAFRFIFFIAVVSAFTFVGGTNHTVPSAHAAVTLEVMNPRGEFTPPPISAPSARLEHLKDKKIGIYWNQKSGAENYLDVIEELLKEKFPGATISRYKGPFDLGQATAAKIAKESDAFVYGVGDTTSCTWAGVVGSSRLEKNGKPAVLVVTDKVGPDARSSAEDTGIPGLRVVTVPAKEYYKQRISREEVRPIAVATVDAIIEALTRPLSSEETSTEPKLTKMERTIKVTAENYEAALEKFNQLFLDNRWGSGLPLIPPTEERVKWMLAGTSRSPQEVVGKVAPKNGIATIEKIAINAVMGGAKPEYLPVIIAAIEAVTDRFDLQHVMTSSGSFTLLIQLNGPLAEEIGMHSGTGFLGHGWRANNTIGHAVRLALINLGHLWPGQNDVALTGRPSSHTFYTCAENEQYSPWEPYHVALGFKKEDSCVTVATVNSGSSLGTVSIFGGGAVTTWTGQGLLDTIAKSMTTDRARMTIWKLGTAITGPMRHTLFLAPELAAELNRMGYSRKGLQKYLYESTTIPFDELSPRERESVQRRIEAGEIPTDRIPVFKEAFVPGGKVPLLLRPEDIHIVVAGGIPAYSFGMFYFSIPPYNPLGVQTKLIRGATLTKAGR